MKSKKIKLILIGIFFTGCAVTPQIYTTGIRNLKTIDNSSIIYSLPRTVFQIEVTFQKAFFIPGPYHEFADKYLGIKDVIHNSSTSWTIDKIVVSTCTEPDPEFFFSVRVEKHPDGVNDKLALLEQKGLISLPPGFLPEITKALDFNSPGNEIYFKDLSMKRNLVSEKETSYKRVLRDSVYVQIPVETESHKPKSLEQKAEEAANFLIKLKKRKFKLLTGQNEGPVPDDGINTYLEELNRIEDEYLSLFIGKTVYETQSKSYEFTPVSEKKTDQQVLFRLSEKEGIFDALSSKGKPFVLELTCTNVTLNFDKIQLAEPFGEIENTLYYRLPDFSVLRLILEDKVMFEGKYTTLQFGPVISAKILRD